MNEAQEIEEKTIGKLEDLASDPKYLNEYLAVRVDISEEEEVGSILGHGKNLEDLQKLVEEDQKSSQPGNEYHIFNPQQGGKTARKVSSMFAKGNRFKKAKE